MMLQALRVKARGPLSELDKKKSLILVIEKGKHILFCTVNIQLFVVQILMALSTFKCMSGSF